MARFPNNEEYLPVHKYQTKSVAKSSVISLFRNALRIYISNWSNNGRPA